MSMTGTIIYKSPVIAGNQGIYPDGRASGFDMIEKTKPLSGVGNPVAVFRYTAHTSYRENQTPFRGRKLVVK